MGIIRFGATNYVISKWLNGWAFCLHCRRPRYPFLQSRCHLSIYIKLLCKVNEEGCQAFQENNLNFSFDKWTCATGEAFGIFFFLSYLLCHLNSI